MRRTTPAIAVLGTASNVGKTTLAAALCRVFSDAGVRVAPFKAQNMDSRVMRLDDGRSMAWAQGWQADAARVAPQTDMNPIVLQPLSSMRSRVILNGRPLDIEAAQEWMRKVPERFVHVQHAYDRLAQNYEVIVIEGAGSAAELNLWKTDLVNWPTVRHADAQVVLVGDISNGGVFAQLIGTVNLLPDADRARICGLVVNNFRGDQRLFDDGVALIEEATKMPVLGVLPTLEDWHPEEGAREAHLARLAEHVRMHVDLETIQRSLGLTGPLTPQSPQK